MAEVAMAAKQDHTQLIIIEASAVLLCITALIMVVSTH